MHAGPFRPACTSTAYSHWRVSVDVYDVLSIIIYNKSSARAPLGAREGFEQTIGGVQRGLLLPNERFKRSEPRGLGVRPEMTGRR